MFPCPPAQGKWAPEDLEALWGDEDDVGQVLLGRGTIEDVICCDAFGLICNR